MFYNQIKGADLLLFNKVDLLPAENIPRYLEEVKELNPYCTVVPTEHCLIEPTGPLAANSHHGQKEAEISLAPFKGEHHGNAEEMGYLAFAFEEEKPLREDCFLNFIQSMPAGLYRIKGYVRLGEPTGFYQSRGEKDRMDPPGYPWPLHTGLRGLEDL